MDMIPGMIAWSFGNFALVMLILAFLLVLISRCCPEKKPCNESFYRMIAIFPLGLTGVYTFIMHAFFPEMTAKNIGWTSNPFQYEVAMADLAIGVIGLISAFKPFSFRLATVIAATIWLWGDALGHFYQLWVNHNFAPGNAGSWFYMDIIVPFLLIISLAKQKCGQNQC